MEMTLGKRLRVTIFGESHGKGVGALVQGIPAGITVDESASKLRLAPGNEDNPNGETRAHIVFQASADAKPVSNLPIAVMGYVSINFVVKVGYSTPPLFLTVTSELTAANNQVE